MIPRRVTSRHREWWDIVGVRLPFKNFCDSGTYFRIQVLYISISYVDSEFISTARNCKVKAGHYRFPRSDGDMSEAFMARLPLARYIAFKYVIDVTGVAFSPFLSALSSWSKRLWKRLSASLIPIVLKTLYDINRDKITNCSALYILFNCIFEKYVSLILLSSHLT